MGVPIVQAVLLLTTSYVLWRVLRPFVVKSSLANIPGPPPASWWKGTVLYSLRKLPDRTGLARRELSPGLQQRRLGIPSHVAREVWWSG